MEAMLLKLVESCVSIQNYRNDNGNNTTEAGWIFSPPKAAGRLSMNVLCWFVFCWFLTVCHSLLLRAFRKRWSPPGPNEGALPAASILNMSHLSLRAAGIAVLMLTLLWKHVFKSCRSILAFVSILMLIPWCILILLLQIWRIYIFYQY